MKWNKHVKPPENVCPERFCFHWGWNTKSCRVAGITSKNCKRLDKNSTTDWYEAHEVELEKHDLPWFYFYPSKEKLVEKLREDYERETEELWGTDT